MEQYDRAAVTVNLVIHPERVHLYVAGLHRRDHPLAAGW